MGVAEPAGRRLRIVYLTGEGDPYAAAGLRAILQAGHRVVLVIATRSGLPWIRPRVPPVDWPLHAAIVGARGIVRALRSIAARLRPPAPGRLQQLCEERGIPLILTSSRRIADHGDAIRDAGPDILLANGWLYHIPPSVCRLARIEALNCHPAYLPEYRGSNTTFAALVDCAERTGVSVHVITPRFDAGPILARRSVPIGRWDSVWAVYGKRLAVVGLVICEALQVAGEPHRYLPNPPAPAYRRCATATYLRRRFVNLARTAIGLAPIPFPPAE